VPEKTGAWDIGSVGTKTERDDRSARDALLDATLQHLHTQGVLAGLNLRAVAETAGVTPANIYHYFGSRRGLLRAAIGREAEKLEQPLSEVSDAGFLARRTRMFDAILANPTLTLTSLLAIDGDPDYEPLPFLDATRAHYQALVARGDLRGDVDVEAAHLLALAMSIGVAIYAEAAARQMGTTTEDVHARTRAVFASMLEALVGGAEPAPRAGAVPDDRGDLEHGA
jgi:AcrR family transcriptional regulator